MAEYEKKISEGRKRVRQRLLVYTSTSLNTLLLIDTQNFQPVFLTDKQKYGAGRKSQWR
jgi:hypothetical protein